MHKNYQPAPTLWSSEVCHKPCDCV